MQFNPVSSVCVLCGQWVSADNPVAQLCSWCLESLPWNESPCEGCGLPITICHQQCPRGPITKVVSPLLYRGCAARWVVRGKHPAGMVEARLLGTLLAQCVRDTYPEEELPRVLIPVPLTCSR